MPWYHPFLIKPSLVRRLTRSLQFLFKSGLWLDSEQIEPQMELPGMRLSCALKHGSLETESNMSLTFDPLKARCWPAWAPAWSRPARRSTGRPHIVTGTLDTLWFMTTKAKVWFTLHLSLWTSPWQAVNAGRLLATVMMAPLMKGPRFRVSWVVNVLGLHKWLISFHNYYVSERFYIWTLKWHTEYCMYWVYVSWLHEEADLPVFCIYE